MIVWDPTTKTEHFIRYANFRSSTKEFGFIVPTPTQPTLAEADHGMFSELAHAARPEHRTEIEGIEFEFHSVLELFFSRGPKDAATSTGPVRILATASVAGYDATVLAADDPRALSHWLGEHGFEDSPELEAWLGPYVAKQWTVTAFQVKAEAQGQPARYDLGTRAVRMSFKTDRPFYPYREPAGQQQPATGKLQDLGEAPTSRLLRVYVLGPERVDASVGGAPWSAEVVCSRDVEVNTEALRALGVSKARMTLFHDDSFPRRGVDEVYFDRAVDLRVVDPPAIITTRPRTIWIPLESLLLAAGLGVWGVRALRRRRRQ